jgi:hypothetical protein
VCIKEDPSATTKLGGAIQSTTLTFCTVNALLMKLESEGELDPLVKEWSNKSGSWAMSF